MTNADTSKMDDVITVTREGAVAIITLSNAARRNAMGLKMRQQLVASFEQLMADKSCRAIVLTGAGGHFCAGGDISEMKQRTLLENRSRWSLPMSLVRLMATGPKPIVAAVEGVAVGAGMSLVALCDYAVAARNAKFAAAFVKVGILPDVGAFWSVPRKVGFSKARELFGLARQFEGEEAARIGLVNQLAEPGAALADALAVAQEYAAMPPVAMALLKSALAEGVDTLAAAMRSEVDLQTVAMATRDHQEAVSAFLEKRKPEFTGE